MKTLNKDIGIIGLPMDMGAQTIGARLGPEAIRIAGLNDKLRSQGHTIKDYGNLEIQNEYKRVRSKDNMNHKDIVLGANQRLFESVDRIIKSGDFPLILGGDHSLVLGSFSAVLANYKNPGLIYFDAHGDINTSQTSPTGNIHGMPLSMLMGYGPEPFSQLGDVENKLKAENIVFIGLSDLDAGEIEIIKEKNIKAYTINDIANQGIGPIVKEAITYLEDKTDGIHVSFDVDVMDPKYAPGTGINLEGGLDFREARLALEMVAQISRLTSFDLVEVNPLKDHKNQTAQLAVDLICTFFGKRIL